MRRQASVQGPAPRKEKLKTKRRKLLPITLENPIRGSSKPVSKFPNTLPEYSAVKRNPACESVRDQWRARYGSSGPSRMVTIPM
jgi:hypothetical protein